ncbi:MAG TPA: glycosyltransferase, partial [Flavisolibacter sp.]|nr:glycosyltransferase [Flavisolibacter sp.]
LLGILLKIMGYKGKLITYVRFLPNSRPPILRRIWLALAVKYADRIVAVSDAVLKQLPKTEKALRIYNTVHFSEFLPEKCMGDQTVIRLLYVSNYIPGKGQNYALDAFKIAFIKDRRLRLIFMGGDMGLQKNRLYREGLQKLVAEAGLSEVVEFLPFELRVENRIKNSEIVLNFSESESFSMTCAEACFYGAPVIATRCGGPEEIIIHEKTGLLVDNKNVQQMADAILRLAGNPNLQKEFGRNAREYVLQKFNKVNFEATFKNFLTSLARPETAYEN